MFVFPAAVGGFDRQGSFADAADAVDGDVGGAVVEVDEFQQAFQFGVATDEVVGLQGQILIGQLAQVVAGGHVGFWG